MNKLFVFLFLFSFKGYSQVSKVSPGQLISADHINKIIDELVPIGTVYESLLTLDQFLEQNGDCWRLMNGASLVGTDLGALTGKTVLPNAVANGEFLRQAKNNTELGVAQGDAIRNITAQTNFASDSNGTMGVGPGTTINGAFFGSGSPTIRIGDADGGRAGFNYLNFDASRVVPTASENRPYNISVNFFIKVNKVCN